MLYNILWFSLVNILKNTTGSCLGTGSHFSRELYNKQNPLMGLLDRVFWNGLAWNVLCLTWWGVPVWLADPGGAKFPLPATWVAQPYHHRGGVQRVQWISATGPGSRIRHTSDSPRPQGVVECVHLSLIQGRTWADWRQPGVDWPPDVLGSGNPPPEGRCWLFGRGVRNDVYPDPPVTCESYHLYIYIFLWHIMVNPGRRYLEVFQCNWKNQVQYMLERCDGFCCKGSLFVFASVLPKVEAKRRRGKIPVTTSPEVWQANTTIYTCNYMQQSIYADCLGRACQPKTSQALFVVLFCFVCCFFATRLHNRSFTSRVIAKENGIVWSDRGGLWTRQDVCGKCP